MTIVGFETRPATGDRFADVATILAPKRAGAQGCWCLSRRLSPTDNKALSSSQERGQRLEALCNSGNAPGVLAYQDDDVVGWAAIALREQLHGFSPRRFPIDPDGNVWVVSCFRVRAGHGPAATESTGPRPRQESCRCSPMRVSRSPATPDTRCRATGR